MEGYAEFDFEGRADDELSFQIGTLLLITNTAEDDNWYRAILKGSEGYIPKNYVNFTMPRWFWGKTSRLEAEKSLTTKQTTIGGFCIRKSETVQGAYSLSVKNGRDTVQHYKVLPDRNGLYYIWLKKFKSLNLLVEYYRTHSVTTNATLVLRDIVLPLQTGSKKCRALFDFNPVENGELALQQGDVIEVIDDTDFSWWRGSAGGKTGLFPANYVAVIEG